MTAPSDPAALQAAWLQLAAALAIDDNSARDAYIQLERHYGQDHRAYHTLAHIADALHHVQRLSPYVQKLTEVQAAAWLHDVIYDPQAADNEEKSASYAAELLQALGQPPAFTAAVQRLILLTRDHHAAPDDVDGSVLLDADLAILGEPPPVYARYAAAIRREYAWLPDTTYQSGRLALLKRFLQRPFIYHTPFMRREREQAARANLLREIERLS